MLKTRFVWIGLAVGLALAACKEEKAPAAASSACPKLVAAIDRAQADLEALGNAPADEKPEDAAGLPRKTAIAVDALKKAVDAVDAKDPTTTEYKTSIAMLAGLAHEALGALDRDGKHLAEIQLSMTALETKGNEELETAKKALLDLDEGCASAKRPACEAARKAIEDLERPLPTAYDPATAKEGAQELSERFDRLADAMTKATGDDDARTAIATAARKGAASYRELAKGMDDLGKTLESATRAQKATEESLSRLDAELRAAEEACGGAPAPAPSGS